MSKPEDRANKVRADLIRLYDRMKEAGWLNGYTLTGNAAVLDFTANGAGATTMLNRLFFDGDVAKPLDAALVDGLIPYLETIVRHIEDPARNITGTRDQN
jgi:hypothetical protein